MTSRLVHGDCLIEMAKLEASSVDAICCDPPYGIGFMGKEWDSPGSFVERPAATANRFDHVGGNHNPADSKDTQRTRLSEGRKYGAWCETWAAEALRVAKPGAHLVAFGGTRTFHRLTCAIEDAGWEIRDCLMWLYGSGFPKSLDVSKALDKAAGATRERIRGPITAEAARWQGWGTALKPAWEPIVLARKPLAGTVAANVAAHGTGALNIDGCRIGLADDVPSVRAIRKTDYPQNYTGDGPGWGRSRGGQAGDVVDWRPTLGRWPANVVLDQEAAAMLDAQTGELTSGKMLAGTQRSQGGGYHGHFPSEATANDTPGDSGGASRFFYCAKASRAEREAGLENAPYQTLARSGGAQGAEKDGTEYDAAQGIGLNRVMRVKNHHPTVKPVALMRWLVRLVTPPGGLVLDLFAGSGSSGIGCMAEGFRFLGIEREADYCAIARRRIAEAAAQGNLFEAAALAVPSEEENRG